MIKRFHNDITLEFKAKMKPPVKEQYPLSLIFSSNRTFKLLCKSRSEQEDFYNKFISVFNEYKLNLEKRTNYHQSFHPTLENPFKNKLKNDKKIFFVEVWENERWVGGFVFY